jgi:hypothetical protein
MTREVKIGRPDNIIGRNRENPAAVNNISKSSNDAVISKVLMIENLRDLGALAHVVEHTAHESQSQPALSLDSLGKIKIPI